MDAGTIITRAQRLAGRVDSKWDSRTLEFINEGIERWALTLPWNSLKGTVDVPCDGTSQLVLPDYVRVVRWMLDKTNTNRMDYVDDWDRMAHSTYLQATAGAAEWWREVGSRPVYRQPASAGVIGVQSTVSENVQVHIAGVAVDTNASGTAGYTYFAEEVVTASGGSAVGTIAFQEIIGLSKVGTSSGECKIFDAASNQLARIAPYRYNNEYRAIELMHVPSAGTVLRAGFLYTPPQVLLETHSPHPSVNPNYLAWYAAALIHKSQNEADLAAVCTQRADEIMQLRIKQDQGAGDQDWQSRPDPEYWGFEESWQW